VMPTLPSPDEIPRANLAHLPTWVHMYDMRFADGQFSGANVEAGPSSVSTLWVRDGARRRLDFPAVTALSDIFFPRIFLRRGIVPSSTISMTTYFHADSGHLEALSGDFILATAHANRFDRGFFDQSAQLWGRDGALLATTYQIVYFKG